MNVRAAVIALAVGASFPAGTLAQSAEVRVIEATPLAPAGSLRPAARPGSGTPVPSSSGPGAIGATVSDTIGAVPGAEAPAPNAPRGLADLFRPRGETTALAGVGSGGSTLAITQSLRPQIRPDGLEGRVRSAATRNTPGRVAQPGRNTGTLCGVVGLQGEEIEAVTGRISGCGIPNAVRLRVVHGVQLTTPATINCTTAQSLSQWVLDADEIIGGTGGGIANMRVMASYACRTRNSRAGARLSEHATGSAIDIGGIGLQNGNELSVLGDWRGGNSAVMRELHAAACGTFGTVLGPESDRFHQDHFHFDVASYRSGSYCR
ncbi:extensin family protein [Gymnodinialimonas ceratoperidinii]|uniref:Extensin family protein n=1 Tax=Gymnodinialimonas ceratoperidinii TaxID=2856823 RepID=A0A8F6YAQ7_9RHOB|nr:extensin family protein [Gymnodinialimonas ceratoperidinii]QXT39276.1 extensin family protein [Gymnodinialimonas ceratoperidinii]